MLKQNQYAHLPEYFYAKATAARIAAPRLMKWNTALARSLNWSLNEEENTALLSGNRVAPDTIPIAMAYAGHQFGNFVPQLGDGRALLIGEVSDQTGKLFDVQLKGSGPTAFSRNGDGRAALGPVIREYIMSEAMHALGIPTTRALAIVTTGEPVFRETPLPGAILTRVAASHIRIGTFEYFAARRDVDALKLLADYCIDRHYPDAKSAPNPYQALLQSVIDAQAFLIAKWMQVGFIHGVMNTDNMTISGETIDYGPCAFMDNYDPATVYSAIDRNGRYAFGNQPAIAHWNLTRFAEALLPLFDSEIEIAVTAAEHILDTFPTRYVTAWRTNMRQKLGLTRDDAADDELIDDFLTLLHEQQADYTNSFRDLSAILEGNMPVPAAYETWMVRWQQRIQAEPYNVEHIIGLMHTANPAFIPRNHRVETAIRAGVDRDDFSVMNQLLEVITNPYGNQPEYEEYRNPPLDEQRVLQTFCGT